MNTLIHTDTTAPAGISTSRRHFLTRTLTITTGLTLSSRGLAAPGPSRIKLGTLVPKGSSYYRELQRMGETWRNADPALGLIIYPDGVMGGEVEMVRRIRLGQLHGGLLTAVGLMNIEREIAGLQNLPLMFHDLDDVDHVGEKLHPMLEKKLEDKGFVVLFWADAGWVRFFTKQQVRTPQDMKRLKIFCWSGDSDQFELMKRIGLNPVSLEVADILPGLKTGLIDAVPMPPFAALAAQVDMAAPYMLELNYAPLVGAAVISKKVWDTISPSIQAPLLASAKVTGAEIKKQSRKEALESVAAMEKRGLKVHKPTPAEIGKWQALLAEAYPTIRGKIVPEAIFDEAKRLLDERHGKGSIPTP